jgi:hypothetical protein
MGRVHAESPVRLQGVCVRRLHNCKEIQTPGKKLRFVRYVQEKVSVFGITFAKISFCTQAGRAFAMC